jgi:hypothetical protein
MAGLVSADSFRPCIGVSPVDFETFWDLFNFCD